MSEIIRVPPQATVAAKLVLSGFGHEVATEHVRAALAELVIWQRDNPHAASPAGGPGLTEEQARVRWDQQAQAEANG